MKLTNVFLILMQFTLYLTNKSYKNVQQKLVRFVQTGQLSFICFVHCSQQLKSSRGALIKKSWRWKTNDWVNTAADTKLDKDCLVISKISSMSRRALDPKDENTSSPYRFSYFYIGWLREFDGKGLYCRKTKKSWLLLAGHLIGHTTVLIKWFHDLNSAKWLLITGNKILLCLWLLSHCLFEWSPLCKTLGARVFSCWSV